MNRRDFLQIGMLTAASTALAGCGRATEGPFVSQAMMPEFYLPGVAQYYATTCTECSAGCGLAIRVIGGRAKKVEGIPTHPVNHGGHCLRAESGLNALYNPDRLSTPLQKGAPITDWDTPIKALAQSWSRGSGLWITGPLRGTVGALVVELARRSGAKIWVLDFCGTASERAALKALGAQPQLPYLHLATADYVVNFGGDFLATGPNAVGANWAYGEFRQGKTRKRRGLMVSFASRMNLTVSNSDRWVPVRPGTEGYVAAAVSGLLHKGLSYSISPASAAKTAGISEDLIHRLADKLKSAQRPLAIGGLENLMYSNGVWALTAINSLNRALHKDNGVTYEPDALVAPKGMTVQVPGDLLISTRQAVEGLQRGTFKTVWVYGANPVYLMPKKLDIGSHLRSASTFTFSPYLDETGVESEWVLPTTSFLEEWADARLDGPEAVYGLVQPVVKARPGSIAFGDILLQAAAQSSIKGNLSVTSMRDLLSQSFSDQDWVKVQEKGGLWKDASLDWEFTEAGPLYPQPPTNQPAAAPPKAVSLWSGMQKTSVNGPSEAKLSGSGKYVLVPYPSSSRHDGSLANRPWIQELPDPVSQANWTSWVEINPETAKELGIDRGDLVEVTSENGSLQAPALVTPAVHPDTVAIPAGMGHASYGRYAFNKGVNVLSILTPAWQEGTDELAWASTRVDIKKLGQKGTLITYDYRVGKPGYTGWDLGPNTSTENEGGK